MSEDPYKVLDVAKTASADDIKKAYRKIARASHPDLNPDDPEAEGRFKAASAAFDLLKDPETRARFDRGEIDASGAERQDRQYYRDYAGSSENPYHTHQGQEGFDDAQDMFAEFLRRQRRGSEGADSYGFHARGQDRRFTLEVSFLDAAKGGSTRIVLPEGGALEVAIPEGIADGKTIRLRGKGAPGFGGGQAGDALITLVVRPDPVFSREDNDILVSLPITFDEAVLGGKVEVPTIHGPVKMTIPEGANSDQVLRLRGRGIKPRGAKTAGDQRVQLKIMAPPKIDGSLRDFMQEWRKTNHYDPRKGTKT